MNVEKMIKERSDLKFLFLTKRIGRFMRCIPNDYNDGKAWLSKGEYKWIIARGTNKVKPLFWLSIWEGFFKVSFFFFTNKRKNLKFKIYCFICYNKNILLRRWWKLKRKRKIQIKTKK